MKVIQKRITIIIWCCNIAIMVLGFFAGFDKKVQLYMCSMLTLVGVAAAILYFIPMHERIKAILVLVMTACSTLGISILSGGNGGTFLSSFLVLAGALLYFDPIVLMAFSSIYLSICLIVFLMNPALMFGYTVSPFMGAVMMFSYAIMTVCLYLATRLGNKFIQLTNMDRKDAQEKSGKSNQQTQAAQEKSELIYQRIEKSRDTIKNLSNEAYEANDKAQHLKKEENETLELFQGVKADIADATEWIEENYELIELLQKNYMAALESVEESKQYSDSANTSMTEISTAILHAYKSIEESSKETDKIAAIIQDINEISAQTNLLAINASIEAARVSNVGNGFEIVADQIRALSVQSKQAAENINKILSVLSQVLLSTNEKVAKGKDAIQHGMDNLAQMVEEIDKIHKYSNQSQETLRQEVASFEEIKQQFGEMVAQVEKSVETANKEMKDLEVVVDAIVSQNHRTKQVSGYLQEMEQVADHLTNQFTAETNNMDSSFQ